MPDNVRDNGIVHTYEIEFRIILNILPVLLQVSPAGTPAHTPLLITN